MAQFKDFSDRLHDITFVSGDHESGEPGHFERTTNFDWESVIHNLDNESIEESKVTFSDMSACFALVIQWILGGDSLALCGARAAALGVYLDPVHNNRFGKTLAQIAREANCTRASLSKSLLNFRDDAGILLSAGKLSESRATYRACQVEAIEKGTHASFKRRSKAN